MAVKATSTTPPFDPHSPSHALSLLPRELQLRVLQLLPPNDIALGARLAFKEAALTFSDPHYRTARLSEPLPAHVLDPDSYIHLAAEAATQQLAFSHKLRLLSTAAASGCETNLDLAWGLLQPCIFPELLPYKYGMYGDIDPGTTAARHGHVHLLRWAEEHGVVLHPGGTLAAVAQHPSCSLSDLQSACELLGSSCCNDGIAPACAADAGAANLARISAPVEEPPPPAPAVEHEHGRAALLQKHGAEVLLAAAGSGSPDAVDKVRWLLQGRQCAGVMGVRLAAAAAQAGDRVLLEWLRSEGCVFSTLGGKGDCGTQRDQRQQQQQQTQQARAGPVGLGGPILTGWPAGGATGGVGYEVLCAALQHSSMELVEWLVDEAGCPLPRAADDAGAARGGPAAAAAAADGGADATGRASGAAHGRGGGSSTAGGGLNPEEVQALWRAAAASGDVAKMRWLRERGVPPWGLGLVERAVASGRLEAVAYLHERCAQPLAAGMFLEAAKCGNVEVAAWLRERGCPQRPTDGTGCCPYSAAASRGDVGMVRWLAAEARCPWNSRTWYDVVRQWPHHLYGSGGRQGAGGGPAGTGAGEACRDGESGCVGALRALLRAGCAPGGAGNVAALDVALRQGDLAVVQFLHTEAGCPLPQSAVSRAAQGGNEALLEWLVLRSPRHYKPRRRRGRGAGAAGGGRGGGGGGMPWEEEGDAYLPAAVNGDLGTLAALRRLRVPYSGHSLSNAVRRGVALPVVRWLVENGVPAGRAELAAALKEAMQLPSSAPPCLGEAALGPKLELVAYLEFLKRGHWSGLGMGAGGGGGSGASSRTTSGAPSGNTHSPIAAAGAMSLPRAVARGLAGGTAAYGSTAGRRTMSGPPRVGSGGPAAAAAGRTASGGPRGRAEQGQVQEGGSQGGGGGKGSGWGERVGGRLRALLCMQ